MAQKFFLCLITTACLSSLATAKDYRTQNEMLIEYFEMRDYQRALKIADALFPSATEIIETLQHRTIDNELKVASFLSLPTLTFKAKKSQPTLTQNEAIIEYFNQRDRLWLADYLRKHQNKNN